MLTLNKFMWKRFSQFYARELKGKWRICLYDADKKLMGKSNTFILVQKGHKLKCPNVITIPITRTGYLGKLCLVQGKRKILLDPQDMRFSSPATCRIEDNQLILTDLQLDMWG